MLETDDFFHIGATHITAGQPCQDHALSGVYDGAAFAIVSDGCSKGRMTDVGARIITLSTAAAIKADWNVNKDRGRMSEATPVLVDRHQLTMLHEAQKLFSLERDDLLATCCYAYVTPKGGLVHIKGDGALALVFKDGTLRIARYEWQHNMPFYPIYSLEGQAVFVELHGGDAKHNMVISEEAADRSPNGTWLRFASCTYSLESGIQGTTWFLPEDLIKRLAYIAVFSDGVTQVEGMDWKEVIADLMAFKTTNGLFAKRRMIRFIQDARKTGKGPTDDISFAVIKLLDEEV